MQAVLRHQLFRKIFLSTIATAMFALAAGATLGAQAIPQTAAVESADTTQQVYSPEPVLYPYIEVTDGCGPYYAGECVNMRTGPGEEYGVVMRLRIGVVLKVADIVERNEQQWYKIAFDGDIRYPERVSSNWYVAADLVHLFHNEGAHALEVNMASTSKQIIVDKSQQMLYAYDGDSLFMQEAVSTGLEFTPTPRGTFTVYKKTPSRYMQGPLPGISDQYYDLPGVPWNLYFTQQGAVIHGAYWHDHFGQRWSHGCVNLPVETAHRLYDWADLGTKVVVQD
ncbi:L,D-transpeptidase family protein [Candidatus Kaiserbacteria bacterium]|nr:L,D-transpeptidase family protein [Candidatus Kaiserbacteria bacterium]